MLACGKHTVHTEVPQKDRMPEKGEGGVMKCDFYDSKAAGWTWKCGGMLPREGRASGIGQNDEPDAYALGRM